MPKPLKPAPKPKSPPRSTARHAAPSSVINHPDTIRTRLLRNKWYNGCYYLLHAERRMPLWCVARVDEWDLVQGERDLSTLVDAAIALAWRKEARVSFETLTDRRSGESFHLGVPDWFDEHSTWMDLIRGDDPAVIRIVPSGNGARIDVACPPLTLEETQTFLRKCLTEHFLGIWDVGAARTRIRLTQRDGQFGIYAAENTEEALRMLRIDRMTPATFQTTVRALATVPRSAVRLCYVFPEKVYQETTDETWIQAEFDTQDQAKLRMTSNTQPPLVWHRTDNPRPVLDDLLCAYVQDSLQKGSPCPNVLNL